MTFRISERGQGDIDWLGLLSLGLTVGFLIFYFVVIVPQNRANAEVAARRQDQTVSRLVIAGKVVNDQTKEWPNNRLVLLFLHNKEVARSITAVGQSPYSQEGIHDGLFVLEAENTYGLTMDMINSSNKDLVFSWNDNPGYGVAYAWIDNFPEGNSYKIPIPPKNISYIVRVITGDINNLPPALLNAGSAMLRDNGAIVVSLPDANQTPSAENINAQIQEINYKTSTIPLDINKFTVPIDNCAGSATVSQRYIQSQTFVHEYIQQTSGGISVELPLFFVKIVPELQTQYGYENGQIETKTVEYNMAAEPHTKVTYIVTWQEIWETGTAKVIYGNDQIDIPFAVKANLVYKIDSVPAACQ